MTTYTNRAIIIISAAVAPIANQRIRALTGNAADERTFTVGLSPTGLPPASHFWCNYQMRPPVLTGVKNALQNNPNVQAQVFELDSWDPAMALPTPEDVLAQVGLKRVEVPL